MSAPSLDRYREAFAAFEAAPATNGKSGAWLPSLRRRAMDRFLELGFPTTRNEDWKFTDISALTRVEFRAASKAGRVDLADLKPFLLDAIRLVFVDGGYSPELSSVGGLPEGVIAGSLARALADQPAEIEARLSAELRDQAFVALNAAFWTDGAFIQVPKGTVLEKPIQLVFVATSGAEPTMAHPRNLVLAGASSELKLVETYVALAGGVYLTNAVTEIVVGENAIVEHYKIQSESEKAFHVAAIQVNQGRSSRYASHSLSLGALLARNDIDTTLGAEGSECALNGLYLVRGRQFVDNHTSIDHVMPHCTSRELYKGVLDGRAKAVFNGKIVVRPDAQKTDARQTNKNLVLSNDTGINSKPQLEIFANDVKCAHGATVGQLDKNAMFYLRARGISEAQARSILTFAFASEVLDEVRVDALREHLHGLIAQRLPGGELAADVVPA